MNDFALPPEHLDELVSAALDGELDAAAADLGLDGPRVAELLRTDPAAVARTEALTAARTALQSDRAPLDDLERRRLVRGALAAADGAGSPPGRQWSTRLVAAGAAAAVVVGVVVVATRSNRSEPTIVAKEAFVSAQRNTSAAPSELPDLGVVDAPDALVAELRTPPPTPGAAQSRGLPPESGAVAPPSEQALPADPTTTPESGTPPTDTGGDEQPGTGPESDEGATPPGRGLTDDPPQATVEAEPGTECLDGLPGRDPDVVPVLVGRLIYRGTPAVVAVSTTGGHTTAWVFEAENCNLLLTTQLS